MNYFAITPDGLSPARLIEQLRILKQNSVTHLYLRAQSLYSDLEGLIDLARQHSIIPIIAQSCYQAPFKSTCGVHTRSNEHFNAKLRPDVALQTASCHNAESACSLLDNGADYVFISPVCRPFSKPGDQRPLIERDALRMLSERYGKRIVLLGGLTPVKIKELQTELRTDFSVAGITMFFNTGNTHE